MKTSAITIQRATKFIALLRPLHFNTKIHTCALDIFLLGKICCRAGSKEAFLKVGTLSVKARAYPRQIKTNKMNFKNAAYRRYSVTMEIFSFTFLFARKFFKHAHSFCRCVGVFYETVDSFVLDKCCTSLRPQVSPTRKVAQK